MTGYLGLGAAAFALMAMYDVNEVRWRNRYLHQLFWAGCLLLVWATAGLICLTMQTGVKIGPRLWAGLGGAVICLGLLCYTLFGALDFDATYKMAQEKAKLTQSGVYALCRHPGWWWLAGFYVFLYVGLSGQALGWAAVLFGVCNGAYVFWQDKWVFPQMFADYPAYQRSTPFLLPNGQSIRRCLATLR